MRGPLKPAAVCFILLIFCLCLSQAGGPLPAFSRKGPPKTTARISHPRDLERRVIRFTNEARRKQGLTSLDQDEALAVKARAHSDDMLKRHFFSHVNPDGLSPKDRIAPVTAQTIVRAGENIWGGSGQDYSDSKLMARVIVDSWMTSPGHRANILNPKYTHIGVGVSTMGKEIRATQLFVQRRPGR